MRTSDAQALVLMKLECQRVFGMATSEFTNMIIYQNIG